jgi:hypothetical protein
MCEYNSPPFPGTVRRGIRVAATRRASGPADMFPLDSTRFGANRRDAAEASRFQCPGEIVTVVSGRHTEGADE